MLLERCTIVIESQQIAASVAVQSITPSELHSAMQQTIVPSCPSAYMEVREASNPNSGSTSSSKLKAKAPSSSLSFPSTLVVSIPVLSQTDINAVIKNTTSDVLHAPTGNIWNTKVINYGSLTKNLYHANIPQTSTIDIRKSVDDNKL